MKTTPPFKKVPLAQVTQDALNSITTLPWFEGFHAGTHTDKDGKQFTFTRADLEQVVSNFVPGTIPFTTGHPEADAPAYGYAQNIKLADDDKLYFDGDRVNVGFAKSVLAGNYGQRSVGLKKDKQKGWYIYHVAFLGAQAPALDLQPVGVFKFAQASADFHDFNFSIETQTANALVRLMQSLHDFFIAEKGKDQADKIIDKWDADWLQRSVIREETIREQSIEDNLHPQFTQHPEDLPVTGITQEQLDAAVKKAAADAATAASADFSKQVDAANARAAAAEAKMADAQKAADAAAFAKVLADCEKTVDAKVAAGHLTPAQAVGLAQFIAHLQTTESTEFQFSKEGAEVKQNAYDFAKSFVDGLGVKSPLGDDQDPQAIGNEDLDAKATQYAKDNNCSYATAIVAVS